MLLQILHKFCYRALQLSAVKNKRNRTLLWQAREMISSRARAVFIAAGWWVTVSSGLQSKSGWAESLMEGTPEVEVETKEKEEEDGV